MPAVFVFLVFIVLAYLAGAVLAYPLFLALDPFLELEYRKYLTYATLLNGILVSVIYLRTYSLLSFKAFGFSGSRGDFIKVLLRASAYGILIILLIELILYSLGIHELDSRRSYTLDEFVIRLLKAVITGLLISLLEEAIFRGGLFAGLHKKAGVTVAVVLSSLLYSAVHFIRYGQVPQGMEIGWTTGLQMLPDAFRRFYEWSIADYFLTLFAFGVLLSLLRLRHGTLAACIGLHAGVVMAIKVSDYYGQRTYSSQFEYLVSQYNSTFGWISFGVMLACISFYYLRYSRQVKP
ncbi:MAG: CPBP family intramembrane glutamic endopeptidase [Gammaproteobacteria bacterium]